MRRRHTLSDSQRAVWDFLREVHRNRSSNPSLLEIARALGWKSATSVRRAVDALERVGLIRRGPGQARSIVLLEEPLDDPNLLSLPILGEVPAGPPEHAIPVEQDGIVIDRRTFGLSRNSKFFGLVVRSDSMINVHIAPGDLAIMESTETCEPQSKQIVSAVLDQGHTLKTYLVLDRQAFLRAENPSYPDMIPATGLLIQGVLRGLVRRFSGGRFRAAPQW